MQRYQKWCRVRYTCRNRNGVRQRITQDRQIWKSMLRLSPDDGSLRLPNDDGDDNDNINIKLLG